MHPKGKGVFTAMRVPVIPMLCRVRVLCAIAPHKGTLPLVLFMLTSHVIYIMGLVMGGSFTG